MEVRKAEDTKVWADNHVRCPALLRPVSCGRHYILAFLPFQTVYPTCHQNKYPSNNLASRPIREGLFKYLAEPVDLRRFEVHSFRIVWRFDEPLLDYAWIQLVQNHLVSDQVVSQVKGVCYFVSALTGIFNKPNRKGEVPRNIYPAVSYWVVARRGDYNHLGLWKDLQTAYPSAQIKSIGNTDLDTTEAISSALYIVLKDHNSGYVRNRVDVSAASCLKANRQGEHPLVRLVLKDRDQFETELLQAVSALDALRMNMTLTLALWTPHIMTSYMRWLFCWFCPWIGFFCSFKEMVV